MTIQHEADGQLGRFYFEKGKAEGELTYRLKDGLLCLDHTGVDDRLEGQGVGKALVARAAEWAREKGFSVQPNCPFAASVMKRTPEYADLLVKAESEE